MEGDDLSNPLIAYWTTAFIRNIIGECLHSIQSLGGKVVSLKTDGFITDLASLEGLLPNTFIQWVPKYEGRVIRWKNRTWRKSNGVGILAWSTRGQLGFESKIIATTGFQRGVYPNKDDLLEVFLNTIKSENKTIEYIQTRLRSASEIYKKGGHVTMVVKISCLECIFIIVVYYKLLWY